MAAPCCREMLTTVAGAFQTGFNTLEQNYVGDFVHELNLPDELLLADVLNDADGENDQAETNEGNNLHALPITVDVEPPELLAVELHADGALLVWQDDIGLDPATVADAANYELAASGGGLMLATDHNAFHPGINSINPLIGLEPFVGNFSLSYIPVDTGNVLMVFPNDMGAQLYDDSSPGQTPFGLQPNGRILYSLAWHSNNVNTPGSLRRSKASW